MAPKHQRPDFARFIGLPCVSQKFVDIVSRFNCEIQTFPLQLFWADDSDAGRYYFMLSTVCIDSVDRLKTTMAWKTLSGAVLDGRWVLDGRGTFVFDRNKMGNHHMWTDRHIIDRLIISSALCSELKARDVTGIDHTLPEFQEI